MAISLPICKSLLPLKVSRYTYSMILMFVISKSLLFKFALYGTEVQLLQGRDDLHIGKVVVKKWLCQPLAKSKRSLEL